MRDSVRIDVSISWPPPAPKKGVMVRCCVVDIAGGHFDDDGKQYANTSLFVPILDSDAVHSSDTYDAIATAAGNSIGKILKSSVDRGDVHLAALAMPGDANV